MTSILSSNDYYQNDFNMQFPKTRRAIVIKNKRWYTLLIRSKTGYPRALMDDFPLNSLFRHLVICYTPKYLPGNTRPFLTKEGKPVHLFAHFDSYLDFFEYLQEIAPQDRHFFEIICGEFPQKPHFDIDIKESALQTGDQLDEVANFLLNQVIRGCRAAFEDMKLMLDLEKDILVYTSHGNDKRSFHVVINNYCHSDNKEAKAFYERVMDKVRYWTQENNVHKTYTEFIDHSVYSARQQFRTIGSQKIDSNRPKTYWENFLFQGHNYTHKYSEPITDEVRKRIVMLYESLVSFTSNCKLLPSLLAGKSFSDYNFTDRTDLNKEQLQECFNMIKACMTSCPFTVKEVTGHRILLKRMAPSMCSMCNRVHENENPYLYIIDGRVYWDCRRSEDGNKLLLGYISLEEPSSPVNEEEEIQEPQELDFQFGSVRLDGPKSIETDKPIPKSSPIKPLSVQTSIFPSQPLPLQTTQIFPQPTLTDISKLLQNLQAQQITQVREKRESLSCLTYEDANCRISHPILKGPQLCFY